jgi:hypothetical protein
MKHEIVDQRSLELHRMIAEKIRQNPELLAIAQSNLKQWCAPGHSSASRRAAFKEWETLLSEPLARVLSTLVSPGENAARLRQSSPFAGILETEERAGTFRRYESLRA